MQFCALLLSAGHVLLPPPQEWGFWVRALLCDSRVRFGKAGLDPTPLAARVSRHPALRRTSGPALLSGCGTASQRLAVPLPSPGAAPGTARSGGWRRQGYSCRGRFCSMKTQRLGGSCLLPARPRLQKATPQKGSSQARRVSSTVPAGFGSILQPSCLGRTGLPVASPSAGLSGSKYTQLQRLPKKVSAGNFCYLQQAVGQLSPQLRAPGGHPCSTPAGLGRSGITGLPRWDGEAPPEPCSSPTGEAGILPGRAQQGLN